METMKRKEILSTMLVIMVGGLLLLNSCQTEEELPQIIKPTILLPASPTPTMLLPTPTDKAPVSIIPTEVLPEVQEPDKVATPVLTETPTPTVTLTPTPTVTPTPRQTEGEVSFSEAGYFFSDSVQIELSMVRDKEGYITYTMDGTEPAEESTRYETPLLLEGTEEASPRVYSIRAKAWYDDGTCSDTYVHTYFVGQQVEERYTTVVFSINGNPEELTEGPDGILYGENYEKRGRNSERVVSVEAITAEGELLFAQFAGARVFGGTSREHPVKSLKLFARKEYQAGKGTFETTMFGSTTLDGTKRIEKYDKLVLRNGGDDFQRGFLRDELAHRLAEKAGFDAYEAVIPAVGYINGEYYGFYWMHESYCDKYFQYRNGKSDGEYIVLEGSDRYKSISSDEAEAAAAKEYNRQYKKFAAADLTEDAVYAEVCAWIDVENYLDYMAFNMYISNYDWPQGNYRCFRYYAAEGEEYGIGEKDGRWRFLMHDADVGFATYSDSADRGASRNDIKAVFTSSNDHYSALLTALVKREDCKQYFIDKMLEYRDGVLSYESVCETLDAMCAERDAELAYYFEYLKELNKTTGGIYAKSSTTERHIEKIKEFAKLRGDYVTKYLEDYFGVELDIKS
ncbi:MAG: CotH kinase family protein [Lachnospiraceae bacterium]|nr:CotH kinase family protein [Lachnospiraceae bacterium]